MRTHSIDFLNVLKLLFKCFLECVTTNEDQKYCFLLFVATNVDLKHCFLGGAATYETLQYCENH